jgi:hypothetical protein
MLLKEPNNLESFYVDRSALRFIFATLIPDLTDQRTRRESAGLSSLSQLADRFSGEAEVGNL